MSSAAGPSIATSGLVLDIDMANTQKSWLGKPTTNLVITKVENYTGWGGAGWWMHPGNTTSVTSQTLPDGSTGLTLTATTLASGGLYGYNSYALGAAYVSGTQYTASFWAKSYNGTASLNVRDSDSGGTLSTGVSGITFTWQRFSFTWTANASTNMLTFTGSNFSLYNVQLETNSFPTPFVDGARSTTQAIVDLTNNNTITATSLTYASDNTFSFNGNASSNYIDCGNAAALQITGAITIDAWVKPTAYTNLGNVVSKNANSGYRFRLDSTAGGLWWYVSGNAIQGGSAPLDTWSHLTVSGDSSGLYAYINGVLVASNATAYAPSAVTGGNLNIGAYGAGTETFIGTIAAVKIYNRRLSITEIQTNFNAARSRYGL